MMNKGDELDTVVMLVTDLPVLTPPPLKSPDLKHTNLHCCNFCTYHTNILLNQNKKKIKLRFFHPILQQKEDFLIF